MRVFNSFGRCLPVLLCLFVLSITVEDRRFDAVETKFIEDVCPNNGTLELVLSATGVKSALRLKNMMTKGYSNCTIVIYSALTGVIVNLDAGPYRPDAVYEGCKDYIQLVPGYNKTRNYNDKATSLVSDSNKIVFRFLKRFNEDYLERSCMILSTAFRRGNGRCSSEEFKCGSGECIWKGFQCDRQLNCPDGSDEFGPRSKMCSFRVNKAPITLKPDEYQWKFTEPTTEATKKESENSFNLAVILAVICLLLIFFCGIIVFTTDSKNNNVSANSENRGHNGNSNNQSSQNRSQTRRPHAAFASISVIRQRPDYRPQNDYLPPLPSYSSLIAQNSNADPPPYSSVVVTEEDDALLQNGVISDPPPPYVP